MAQNIEIAKFSFNMDDVVASAEKLKAAIEELKKETKSLEVGKKNLQEWGQAGTKAFQDNNKAIIENEAKIKALNSEYSRHITVLTANTEVTQNAAAKEQTLNLALSQQAMTIKEAREQNKILNDLRNAANIKTVEGRLEIEKLNSKLDENNKLIKENVDQYTQQKINIGNYTQSIKEAFAQMELEKQALADANKELSQLQEETEKGSQAWIYYNNQIQQNNTQINVLITSMGGVNDEMQATSTISKVLSGNFKGLSEDAQKVGGAGNLLVSTFKGVVSQVYNLIKASLAFIATPIGAAITAIALVVGALYSVFKSFTPIVDKVEQAFSGLVAVFDVVKNLFTAVITGTKSLGQAFNGLSGDMKNAYNDTVKLTKAQQDLDDALQEQEVTSAKNRAEINRLNIQAKDLTKTEEERLGLLDRASKIEDKDFEQRKKNSDELLRIAQEKIRIEGNLTDVEFQELQKRGLAYKEHLESKGGNQDEYFDKLKEALLEQTSVENEFYTNQEKNIVKKNKIIEAAEDRDEKAKADAIKRTEEAAAAVEKAQNANIKKQQEAFDLYVAGQGIRARTLQEELELEQSIAEKRIDILKYQLKIKKITQDEYDTALLNSQNDLAQRQAEIAVDNAAEELREYKEVLNKKIEANQFLSEEIANQRKADNENYLEEQLRFAELSLKQGVTNQIEYDTAVREAREETRSANEAIDAERESVKLEEKQALREIEFEQEIARLEEEKATKFEIAAAQDAENRQLELDAINADKEKGLISEELFNARQAQLDTKYKKLAKERERILAEQKIDAVIGSINAVASVIDKNSAAGKAIGVAQALINTYQGISAGVKLGYPAAIPAVIAATTTGFKAVKEIASQKIPSASGSGDAGGGGSGTPSTPTPGLGADLSSITGQNVNLNQIAASGNSAVQSQIENQANLNGLTDNVANAVEQGARQGTSQGAEQGITNLSDNRQIQENSTF